MSGRARGFSLFEFALVVAIVGALGAALANRLLFYREQAESVAAAQLISTLRVALSAKVSQSVLAQKKYEVRSIVDENPIGWLSEPPKNYLGEYYSPDINTLRKGNWYFDRADKTLVYLLNAPKSFASEPLYLLKFKVKSFGLPMNAAKLDGPTPEIESVVLEQIFPEVTVN